MHHRPVACDCFSHQTLEIQQENPLSLLEEPFLTMIEIKQIQSHLIVSGTLSDPFAVGKIIAFFAISHHGDLYYADLLFHSLPLPTTFIWSTMIKAFAETNQPSRVLSLQTDARQGSPPQQLHLLLRF